MPLSPVLNNQFLYAEYAPTADGTVELRGSSIPLTQGQEYRLSFKVRSTLAQLLRIRLQNSGLSTSSLDFTKVIPADTWKGVSVEFTAQATDENSKLRIDLNMDSIQGFYVDDFKLINLTLERKSYRVMRIQGNLRPGSFLQTLYLREVTESEVA